MNGGIFFKNVIKEYKTSGISTYALDDISFEINDGEFVVIVGQSGAGKTTLLNLLGGMDSVTSGEIIVGGEKISKYSERKLTKYRRYNVGFVFQFYNLIQNLTAFENIQMAIEISKSPVNAKDVLESVELLQRKDNFPSQLSGGEQQRISIARALAKNPSILLCDEPTGALDYKTGKTILKLLYNICKTNHIPVIIVTHNLALTPMADKVIRVKSGKIESISINESVVDINDIEW